MPALTVTRADRLDRRRGEPARRSTARPWSRRALFWPGQQHRELVAAEPERLAALAEARRELREHAIAGRVAEAVVDAA